MKVFDYIKNANSLTWDIAKMQHSFHEVRQHFHRGKRIRENELNDLHALSLDINKFVTEYEDIMTYTSPTNREGGL